MVVDGENVLVIGVGSVGVYIVADAVNSFPEGIIFALLHDVEEIGFGEEGLTAICIAEYQAVKI